MIFLFPLCYFENRLSMDECKTIGTAGSGSIQHLWALYKARKNKQITNKFQTRNKFQITLLASRTWTLLICWILSTQKNRLMLGKSLFSECEVVFMLDCMNFQDAKYATMQVPQETLSSEWKVSNLVRIVKYELEGVWKDSGQYLTYYHCKTFFFYCYYQSTVCQTNSKS